MYVPHVRTPSIYFVLLACEREQSARRSSMRSGGNSHAIPRLRRCESAFMALPYRSNCGAKRRTSLGVGADVAGANPNLVLCSPSSPSLSVSVSFLLSISLLSPTRLLPLDPSSPVYLRRTNYRPPAEDTSSCRQSDLFLTAALRSFDRAGFR